MKRLLVSLTLLLGLAAPVALTPMAVSAVDPFRSEVCPKDADGKSTSSSTVCKGEDDAILGADGILTKVINLLLTVIGIIAVIMIIVGGIRYTTSGGDSSQINSARDTVLYAVIGLVIAIMAYAIINFVISRI